MVINGIETFKKASIKALSNGKLMSVVNILRNGLKCKIRTTMLYPCDLPFIIKIMKSRTNNRYR